MKKIEKKVWLGYFNEIKKGNKKFELRLNDFKCKKGDILVLREWNQKTKQYTGRKLEKKVTFVLKTKDLLFWNKRDIEKKGYLVLSFK